MNRRKFFSAWGWSVIAWKVLNSPDGKVFFKESEQSGTSAQASELLKLSQQKLDFQKSLHAQRAAHCEIMQMHIDAHTDDCELS